MIDICLMMLTWQRYESIRFRCHALLLRKDYWIKLPPKVISDFYSLSQSKSVIGYIPCPHHMFVSRIDNSLKYYNCMVYTE